MVVVSYGLHALIVDVAVYMYAAPASDPPESSLGEPEINELPLNETDHPKLSLD